MNTDAAIADAAERLWAAARSGRPCAPVRDLIDAGDLDAAYAVQQRNVERAVAELGWRPSGRKIGLTAAAVRAQLGVDEPDFGTLYAGHAVESGGRVPLRGLLAPRVEAEIALVLGVDLDGGRHTPDDVAAAIAAIVPSLEIIDSRIADWDITIVDTVADNASFGGYVLGAARRPEEVGDLREVPMQLTVDGAPAAEGSGAASMGSPLLAAAWLAGTMADRGTPLRAGDVILTGSLGPVAPITGPCTVEAAFGDLGGVSVTFTEEDR